MRIRTKIIIKNYELEERRKSLGYTQIDFAQLCNIPIGRYVDIESIKIKPTESEARIIALELETNIKNLFPKGYEKLQFVFGDVENEVIGDIDFDKLDAKLQVPKLLAILPPKEKGVVRSLYGFNDGVFRTLEEVGKEFGVTRERVRQIEAKALERIRQKHKNLIK